jgi:hypothetical protein
MNPVALVAEGRFLDAKSLITASLNQIVEKKLSVLRKVIAESMFTEGNRMRQGRTVLIRRRIRKGKIQRMIRKSAVKGFTLRHGKITRIPAAKRIHMRIVQRRAARKRKAHMQQTLRKRKQSMRKRKAYGIHEE